MSKKPTLGRGFDALIPKNLDSSILEEDKHRVQKILVSDIASNPAQPRREFDKQSLAELTTSVKQHGVLQPIIVVRGKKGYEIVAGERRWRAAQAAKLTHLPAIVRSMEELERIEVALIENIQRVDLSPLEQALSVYKLQQQFNLSLEQIAKKLGKAVSTVSNLTRLLQLPEAARQALADGRISEGHARAILALKATPARQEELLRSILHNGWNVRRAEQFVQDSKQASRTKSNSHLESTDAVFTNYLSQRLKANVKIRRGRRGGQIIIAFTSAQNLANIIKNLHNRS